MPRDESLARQRIPQFMELMQAVGGFRDPEALLEHFITTMGRVYGSRAFAAIATRGLPEGAYRIMRLRTPDGTDHVDHRAARRVAPSVRRGGILSRAASASPLIDSDLDLRDDPAVGALLGHFRSAMAAPIVHNELGFDHIVLFAPEPHAFGDQDLEEMVVRSNLVSAIIGNLAMARRLEEASQRLRREIDAIARIQRSLLPEELPHIPGLRLAASYRTFDRAGGDLYDVGQLGQGVGHWPSGPHPRWAILIGDVSGHGPAAAVVMAMFHAILHAYPVCPRGPGEVLAHINRHLCAKRIEESFVTAFLGFYEPDSRRLVYARAGHHPPLLKSFPHQGEPLHLNAVGEPPLGIVPNIAYAEAELILQPNQTLILYTDGITDARRPDGEPFGVEGVERSLIACTGAPDCAIEHISSALADHQQNVRPEDDQTMLVIQVLPCSTASA